MLTDVHTCTSPSMIMSAVISWIATPIVSGLVAFLSEIQLIAQLRKRERKEGEIVKAEESKFTQS